jgi:membrane protein YdbS with pleckstrin-like domain
VASSNSIGLQPVGPIPAHDATAQPAEPDLRQDDIRRVRLYSRMAAMVSALTLFLLIVGGDWLLDRWVDPPWGGSAPLIAAALLASARLGLAEMRLRTYDVRVANGAVSFTYGRKHYYLPIAHLQLIDTESSPLLRPLGLSRCILHTAGGMVVISPVPIRFVSAIEQGMLEQRAGQPDAG